MFWCLPVAAMTARIGATAPNKLVVMDQVDTGRSHGRAKYAGRLACLLLAAGLLLSGCATRPPLPEPPAVVDVVRMSREGDAPAVIIERMKAARAVYRLPASELARLREQGVADAVIDHMQATQIEAERRDEALRQRMMLWDNWPYQPWRPGLPRTPFGWYLPPYR